MKGVLKVGEDSLIFYGGTGVWLSNSTFSDWKPLMEGLPKGADRRKIFDLVKSPNGDLFAGTRYGLFQYSKNRCYWTKLKLFEEDEFVTNLEVVGNQIYVLTRDHLYTSRIDIPNLEFSKINLIVPSGGKPSISVFRLFWIIHSGEVLGIPGRLLVDFGGLIMLFLSITGLIYFFFPKLIKRIKAKKRLSRMKRTTRFSYQWHLKVGIYSSIILIVVSFTGMFLRPPFLLFVVNGGITQGSKPNTINEKFWHDKLRDIKFDNSRKIFLLATSEGIYYSDDNFSSSLKQFSTEPPISIMGINVFEVLENGDYLVGSFSGAYRWNPYSGLVADYFTGLPIPKSSGLSSPFGSLAIAGYANVSDKDYFFDYDKGVFSAPDSRIMDMPQIVKQSSPFPLWNLSQEVHTGRIYSPLISVFYILIVPLAGIAMLLITITGVLMRFKKKSGARSQEPENAAKSKIQNPEP